MDLSDMDLMDIALDLSYSGFNARSVREEFVRRAETAGRDWKKDVQVVLVAYASVGNNHGKLQDSLKVKNTETGARVNALLRTYNVVARKGDQRTGIAITLPRMGIAFLPLYYIVRRRMKEKGLLQNQFPDTGLDPVLQDPAFAWYANKIGQLGPYEKYYEEFERALRLDPRTRKGEQRPVDWISVAVRGSSNDAYIAKTGTTEDPYTLD